MKAKVNGIEIDGTPDEVAKFTAIMDNMRRNGIHIKPPLGSMPDWIDKTGWDPRQYKTITTTGLHEGEYPTSYFLRLIPNDSPAMNGGCNCTGACQT